MELQVMLIGGVFFYLFLSYSMLPTYAICCRDLNFEFGSQVNEKSVYIFNSGDKSMRSLLFQLG
jgi:cytochrome c oxidase assembly protein Cox11